MASEDEDDDEEIDFVDFNVYPFHHSNIAEHRCAAYLARALPMMMFLLTVGVSIAGIFYLPLLLWTNAILNTWMWIWLVSYALFSIQASCRSRTCIANAAQALEESQGENVPISGDTVHLVMLPNYKEDESILATTLTSLTEARGSQKFRIMLAMEQREGPAAKERADRMRERFARRFTHFSVASHPVDLFQEHLDGNSGSEIPGKSSNLKWATEQAFEECAAAGINLDRVLLTVGDADCIFHPLYFEQAGAEFARLREESPTQAFWTMWQAPQLPFQNYWSSPAPSRVWGYVSSVYENGGAGGLECGGYHMTFSSFTIPLRLVKDGNPWDGDVIADDHHNYLKCFLFSIYYQLCQQTQDGQYGGINPPLVLRPIMLPVKSTSVEAESCFASWKARFNQAKRHTQGVAELAYIFLAVWRMFCSLPCRSLSCCLLLKSLRATCLPLCINMLPICQTIPFTVLTVILFLGGGKVEQCPVDGPESVVYKFDDAQFYFCWFAGGLNLIWPMVTPFALVILASFCMISSTFLEPLTNKHESENEKQWVSVWVGFDGGIPPCCGSKRLALFLTVMFDLIVLFPVVMAVYGIAPAVMAYWNCMVRGNKFDFKSAAKGKKTGQSDAESDTDAESSTDEDEPQGVFAGKNHHWSMRPSRRKILH